MGHDPLQRQVLLAHSLGDLSLPRSMASSRRSLENQALILALARGEATKVIQSREAGVLRLRSKDFYGVTGFQDSVKRNQATINLCANGAVTDLSVH